jgi:hypothetical protein
LRGDEFAIRRSFSADVQLWYARAELHRAEYHYIEFNEHFGQCDNDNHFDGC